MKAESRKVKPKAGPKPKAKAKPKPKPRTKPKTVEQYLAALSPEKRAALERVRKTIRAAAPGAEERLSYGIPGFRFGGKWLVWFGAAKNHCAIYGLVGADKSQLAGYDTSGKGTIRSRPDKPLPAPLIRKLLKQRIAQNAARRR